MGTHKKQELLVKITEEISNLDVAGYLKNEVKDILKHLHFYKIKNIHQNIDALKEYLELLDVQSTKQIHKLEHDKSKANKSDNENIHYFISKKGLKKVGKKKMTQKIWENDFNLTYIMQGIKGLLLLTANEFCNATPTRMSINRLLWQKELENTKI